MKTETKETVELTKSEMAQIACALDFIDLMSDCAPKNIYDFLKRVNISTHWNRDLKGKFIAAADVSYCHCCCEITKPPPFEKEVTTPDDCDDDCPFSESRVKKEW